MKIKKRIFSQICMQLPIMILFLILFVTPLAFILFNAGMDMKQSSKLQMKIPENQQYIENFVEVINAADRMLIRAFINSTQITVFSLIILIGVASMAAFILERRKSRVINVATFLILMGLMIPPSVVTTIWLLKNLNLYKTLPGIIFIEVALSFPFAAILYRGFMVTIPKELDEAAMIAGCKGWDLFKGIIFPLLTPVTVSVIILCSVNIFNDFVNPLYFLPGSKNATVQLTLYNFMTQYSTQWHLLFMNVFVICLPPLVTFLFFNKKIIGGMVAGAIKG